MKIRRKIEDTINMYRGMLDNLDDLGETEIVHATLKTLKRQLLALDIKQDKYELSKTVK